MRNKLLVFRSFAHDPQRILAAIHRLALVGGEPSFNVGFGSSRVGVYRLELDIAGFTDSNDRRNKLDESQLSFRHALSFPHGGNDS